MNNTIRRPRLPRAPKARGELAEARLIAKAVGLNFPVAKPFGDSLPFDVILGAAGRLWRVQVKSAWVRHGRPSAYHFTVNLGRSSHRLRPYTRRDIDFIIAYIGPEDLWYVIPVREIARRTQFKVCLGGRSRFERYREAWHLLTAPRIPQPAASRGCSIRFTPDSILFSPKHAARSGGRSRPARLSSNRRANKRPA